MGNITKAIIPVAGFATRLYPLSKGIKKSLDTFKEMEENGPKLTRNR